jgi:hypothetical protein
VYRDLFSRKIVEQKESKLLKVLSTSDKTEKAENLYASTLRPDDFLSGLRRTGNRLRVIRVNLLRFLG